MNEYTIQFIDGNKITILEEEYRKLLAGGGGLVFIPSLGQTINMLSISRIYPKSDSPDERKHTIGVLHDGTNVVRQFGQWFCLLGGKDERGNYDVKPDPHFYPEVACDMVPSVKDYQQKFAHLSVEERKTAMLGGQRPERYLSEKKLGYSDIPKNVLSNPFERC